MHESFHKIEVEKEGLAADYQNNITFMTQQIAKLTTSNDTKNAELKRLFEELHTSKRKFEEDLKEVEQKNKEQRKIYEEDK